MKLPIELQTPIYGFMASHCLFSAAEIGLFDAHVERAEGVTAAVLAERLGVAADPLERVLLGLVTLGIVQRDGVAYAVTPHLAPYLHRGSPEYCGGLFPHFQRQSSRLFGFLTDALKEARPQWSKIGNPQAGEDAFREVYRTEATTQAFHEFMWALSFAEECQLVTKFDLSRCKRLVDVGGGSGHFSIAALQAFPELTAVVFDRAEVEPCLRKRAQQYGLESRLQFQVGDARKTDFPSGDVFSLGYVLSDFDRENGTLMMTRIHRALPAGGKLIVLEKLFDDDKRGPLGTAMMNLCMLLEMEGKHYTGEEYRRWFDQVGFKQFEIHRSDGEKHALIGTK
jgi:ubiquinone/menaquinone biosynthesis C-methylase UbiE